MESLFNKSESNEDLKKSRFLSKDYKPRFQTISDLKIHALITELALLRNRIENLEDYAMHNQELPEEEPSEEYVNSI